MNKTYLLILIIVLLAILAWSPWLNESVVTEKIQHAEKEYDRKFVAAGLMDGCGLERIAEPKRIPFGFLAEVTYLCVEMAPGQERPQTTAYVSPFGTVHGERTEDF